MALLGGVTKVGHEEDPYLSEVAKFAVDQHNERQNAQLSFVRLVSASKQVVSGLIYRLIIEVESGGIKKLYDAKVLEKAWQNFKSLESFTPHQQGS